MCDSDYVDPTGFWRGAGDATSQFYKGIGNAVQGPNIPPPVAPPGAPTKTAEKIYGAKSDSDEPQLLGTSALKIPLKTVQ